MGRKVRLSQEEVEYRITAWKWNTSLFSGSEGRKLSHFWPLLPNQYRLHAKKELTKQAFRAKYSLTLRPMTPYVALPLFPRRAACRGEICLIIPRRITSSAISRPVHWLIGRSLGCEHPIAITWQICSAVIWLLLPGRGTSRSRSCTDRSASAMFCKASVCARRAPSPR